MGDRVSIDFINKTETSVVLFSHWGGIDFVKKAKQYVRTLKNKISTRPIPNHSDPIGRLEPETVMVDFIREITKNEKLIESNLYLGKDEFSGDNSDNGHHHIKLDN